MHQGEKLKALLEKNNKRQVTVFADFMGVSRNQVYQYFKMEMLHFSVLSKAADFIGIDVAEFLPDGETGQEQGQFVSGNVKSVATNFPELYTQVPFLSAKAQAGLPIMSFENCELRLDESYPVFLPTVTMTKRHLVIELIGDSMEPEIKNGSIVLCESVSKNDIKYESGGVYAVMYANRLVVKRIKTNDINEKNTLTLWSDNERHGRITIQGEDITCMWKVLMKVQEIVR
jgi:phage repressor protein C with HTH and peptisase S24 domain